MKRTARPADHLEPELGEARLERQWAAVQSGLGGPRRRGVRALGWSAAALALGAALLLAYRAAPWRAGTVLPSGALVGSAGAPVQLALDDGSTVKLEPRSQVRVERAGASQVELALLEGGAHFDVAPNRARRFRVTAGAVRVEVIGTRFVVRRGRDAQGLRVEVTVQRGVVEVSRSDLGQGVRRLLAGESWSASLGAPAPAPVTASAAEPVTGPEPGAEPEAWPAAAEPATPEAAEGAGALEGRALRARADRAAPASAPEDADSASALFGEATLARRAGRVAEAAEGYATLLRLHPGDSRAGLCAFELGRLRMDALGDPRGAVAALQQALSAPGSDAFREDAMARLVLAHDALHDRAACQRAREQYLSRYPAGVHVAALSVRCVAE